MGLLSFLQQSKEDKNPIHSASSKSLNSFEAKNNVNVELQISNLQEKGHTLAESIEILFLLDQLGESKEDFVKERSVIKDNLYVLEDGSSFELKNNVLVRKIKEKVEPKIEDINVYVLKDNAYDIKEEQELNDELDEIFHELDNDINLEIKTITKDEPVEKPEIKNERKTSRFSLKN